MKTTINWKKGYYSNELKLFSSGKQFASLKRNAWNNEYLGKTNNIELEFLKKGIFSKKMIIIDVKANSKLAEINFENWGNKANIALSTGQKYYWKYDNLWQTKWSIHSKNELLISYSGQPRKGVIETETDNELLLLSGLMAQDSLKRKVAIFIAIFIPIFMRQIM